MAGSTRRCRRSWASPSLALLALVAPLALSALQGQAGTASLRGTVTAEATEEPLLNARIAIRDTDHSTLTDEEGRFLLEGLAPGAHQLEIHFLGTVSDRFEVELREGDENSVRLDLDIRVIPLPVIAVTIDRGIPLGKLTGFYRRMENEHGQFITRTEIERIDPFATSDLLRRIPGMRIRRVSVGDPAVASSRRRGCNIDYWIDGVRAPYFNIDDVPPTDIDGIEVYRGASEVPVQFKRPTTCAAILIWTRDPGT